MLILDKYAFTEEVEYLFNIFNNNQDRQDIKLVGGCVRDLLLNRKVNDYDFATRYKPDEVIDILNKNNIKFLTIGLKYGTIIAIINGQKFEITSLRKDINQKGRDTDIEFVKDYKEDASRRDFTFNALYMDCKGQITDYFDGINDLKKGLIKFIGNPEERIKEDNLRILRFFRFACYYAYFLGFESLEACAKNKFLIKNLSKNRITNEFIKILESDYSVKILKIMDFYSILNEILISDTILNLDNLEIFYSVKNFLNFKFSYIFILALILSKNKNVLINLILTRNDKKFLQIMEDYKIYNISEFLLKKLFFILKDKTLVKSLSMIYFCNNFTNFEQMNYFFKYIDNLVEIKFNLAVADLVENGFSNNKEYNKIISLSKTMFVDSNFSIDKTNILKNIINNYGFKNEFNKK